MQLSTTLLVRTAEHMNHNVLQGRNSNIASLEHIRLSLSFSLIEIVEGLQVSSAHQGRRPHVICHAHQIVPKYIINMTLQHMIARIAQKGGRKPRMLREKPSDGSQILPEEIVSFTSLPSLCTLHRTSF